MDDSASQPARLADVVADVPFRLEAPVLAWRIPAPVGGSLPPLPLPAPGAKLKAVTAEPPPAVDSRQGVEDALRLAQLDGALGDRFEVLRLLGKGGSGRVYLVRNRRLDRLEALKVLTDEADDRSPFVRRFTQEARLAASLKHPNLVSVFDSGDTGGVLWFTMELVDGPSLARVLEAAGTLSETESVAALLPILDALAYIHERGIVHRDIKPSNIMIDASGVPRLTDFGVAKTLDSARKTATGALLGTPAYLAPEQFVGGQVDGRTDVYALGVTLYELLTGTLPFSGDNPLQIMVTRLSKNPEPVITRRPGLDPALAAVITRTLEREPAQRFASAQGMRDELQRWWDREPREVSLRALGARGSVGIAWPRDSLAPRTPIVRADPPAPSRRRLILAGAAGLPLLLAVAAILGPRAWRVVAPPEQSSTAHMPPSTAVGTAAPPVPIATPLPTLAPPPPQATPHAAPLAAGPTAGPEARPSEQPPRRPVTLPVEVRRSEPVVPAELVQRCSGQEVMLALVIAEDGSVRRARVLRAAVPACGEIAVSAARLFEYRPALDASGAAVEASISIAVALGTPESPAPAGQGGLAP
jgi:serine/threonine-protein kinase